MWECLTFPDTAADARCFDNACNWFGFRCVLRFVQMNGECL